jgi:ATP-dependent RNA helicase DDX1
VSFSKNGKVLGVAFKLATNALARGWFPAFTLKNAEISLNFGGAVAFQYPPPSPYAGFASAVQAAVVDADTHAAAEDSAEVGDPVALILEPSRELAAQVCDELDKFKPYLTGPRITHGLFVGGVDIRENIRVLRSGCHIVVGTPGRIIDLVESGKMRLGNVRFFVLDEADRLLDTGNQESIMKLHQRAARNIANGGGGKLQTLLFSATLHDPVIKALSTKIQQHPTWVDLKGKDAVPETVHHVVVRVDPRADTSWKERDTKVTTDGVHADSFNPKKISEETMSEAVKRLKPHLLVKLVEKYQMAQAFVFVRTQLDCDHLEAFLVAKGGGKKFSGKVEGGPQNPLSCSVLHGGRSHGERQRNLEAFKEGDVRLLIATDVAARGLDIVVSDLMNALRILPPPPRAGRADGGWC